MTYWNGSRWTPEDSRPPRIARVGLGRRLLGASSEAALIILLTFGLIVGTAFAAKGGNGGGNPHRSVSICQIDGNTVIGTGLPTDEVLNFMVTEGASTWGWALGFAGDSGTWDVPVPDRSGSTRYEFASRTYGPNGEKYEVFATCSTDG
jgi:hypothetical protein